MLDSSPPVLEDARYREELALREEAILHEQGEERRGLLETLGARLAAAADVGEAPGEPQYALKDLDIDFPSQWAAADFVDGREWWLHQESGELEKYLHTRPFETYTSTGPAAPEPGQVDAARGGPRQGRDSGPRRGPPVFGAAVPLSVLRVGTYAVRVYVIRAANVEPQGRADGRPLRPHQARRRRPDGRRAEVHPEAGLLRVLRFSTRLPGPAQVQVQLRDRSRWRPAHAVLGESRLDLEDRWFDRKWQALDERSRRGGVPLKPIEVRRLTRGRVARRAGDERRAPGGDPPRRRRRRGGTRPPGAGGARAARVRGPRRRVGLEGRALRDGRRPLQAQVAQLDGRQKTSATDCW